MSYADAMRILDKVKDGTVYPDHVVTQALKMTGDLDE